MLDHTSHRDLFWILFALMCFCLKMPGTYAQNPLRLDPPTIVVQYGDSASLNCSTNVTHRGMGWEASQGAVDRIENVQLITWTVKKIEHWDINPICYINADQQYELKSNIIVYKPPDQVSISTVNHTGPMIEGRLYELQCDVRNVTPVHLLTVNWYKGQDQINTTHFSDHNVFPVSNISTLQISPRRGDDGVQYRCEAELKLGPEGPQPSPTRISDPLNITVHFGPEILNCSDVVRLNEGENLEGYCNVNGKPFPVVYWERESVSIDPSIPLNRTSSGKYKIFNNGTAIKNLTVEVMYGPEISCENYYSVVEYEHFTPSCTVAGNPPFEMLWFKDEDEEVDFPQIWKRSDAGQYVLRAIFNNDIFANHTLEIDVLYPPTVITELQNEMVSKGIDVVLKCVSSGKPRPKYTWIYHMTSNVIVTDQDGVSLLHINHAGENNIGTYKCIASNDLGQKSQTVRVDVQGVASSCPLSISPRSVELEYGQSVKLECNSPTSKARLSWKFSDITINESTLEMNSSWVINSLGWYGSASCHGEFVGLDACRKDLNVRVYKQPDQVSISTLGRAGPITEGKNYTLQCDIKNVAPVQFLVVKWYEGEKLVKEERFTETKNPDNVTTTLKISPSRNRSEIQYRCDAELNLGSRTPKRSDLLSITVHYKPTISANLPEQVPFFHDYEEKLVCVASGSPKPTITWIGKNLTFSETLTIKEAGKYTCFANNSVGNDTRVVTVVMKEDYLPLIAGLVALMVVIISVVFISIYSIYYTNTKMGHYTVEGATPKAQNGNVARNGKDSTIPMKKIFV